MGAVQPGQPVAHEHQLVAAPRWPFAPPGQRLVIYCLGVCPLAQGLLSPDGMPDYTRAGMRRWT